MTADIHPVSSSDHHHEAQVTANESNQNGLDNLPWSLDQNYPSKKLSQLLPPILRLRAFGLCCPFLETEEEQSARVAAYNLQNYPILWYRKKLLQNVGDNIKQIVATDGLTRENVTKGLNSLIGGCTGTANNTLVNDDNATVGCDGTLLSEGVNGIIDGLVNNVDRILGENSEAKSNGDHKSTPMVHVKISATLTIADTSEYGPAIKIQATEFDDLNNEDDDRDTEHVRRTKSPKESVPLPSKIIPLSLVDSVSSGWNLLKDSNSGGVRLFSKQKRGLLAVSGDEILRFDTLGGGGTVFSPNKVGDEPNEHSEEVINYLRTLVQWNQQRIALKGPEKVKCSQENEPSKDYL